MIALGEIETNAEILRRFISATPQICWPLLTERCGAEIWVKHENHTPIGAFKIRGGLTYLRRLRERDGTARTLVTATTGNHGQSVALAAKLLDYTATIVVPRGNNPEKNAAMRAFGADLVVAGHDFQGAYEHARGLSADRKWHFVPSFHPDLVLGVASYALELLRGVEGLDVVYVPIGLGSGICGMVAARDALGLKTRIVGVVAARAPTYDLSFAAGRPIPTDSADTIADGLACGVPDPEALATIVKGVERIVSVEEHEIAAAMRHLFSDTHNLAEGASASALAAVLKDRARIAGRRIAIVLSGGNVDRDTFARIIAMPAQNADS